MHDVDLLISRFNVSSDGKSEDGNRGEAKEVLPENHSGGGGKRNEEA